MTYKSFVSFIRRHNVNNKQRIKSFTGLPFSREVRRRATTTGFTTRPRANHILTSQRMTRPLRVARRRLAKLVHFRITVGVSIRHATRYTSSRVVPPTVIPVTINTVLAPLSFSRDTMRGTIVIGIRIRSLTVIVTHHGGHTRLSSTACTRLHMSHTIDRTIRHLRVLIHRVNHNGLGVQLQRKGTTLGALQDPDLQRTFRPLGTSVHFVNTIRSTDLHVLQQTGINHTNRNLVTVRVSSHTGVTRNSVGIISATRLRTMNIFSIRRGVIFKHFSSRQPTKGHSHRHSTFNISHFRRRTIHNSIRHHVRHSPLFQGRHAIPYLISLVKGVQRKDAFHVAFPIWLSYVITDGPTNKPSNRAIQPDPLDSHNNQHAEHTSPPTYPNQQSTNQQHNQKQQNPTTHQ